MRYIILSWLMLPSVLFAAEPISFNRDIRPILSNRCFKCHGPDARKGGLDLQSHAEAIKEQRSGEQAIVPGKPAESEMIRRATLPDGDRHRMPPTGERLSKKELDLLRAWIEQGAGYQEHWAYVAPKRPALPSVQDVSWTRNPIDTLVLARLEREKLKPSPEAEPAVLLRRVSLDLTGLPPSVADLEKFLNDKSPGAFERAVDRLLASPHYGEHQARYWLDSARYADTNGYEKDERRTIWPYRDWVIAAFNQDMPFDQFTIEQIAGDLLPKPSNSQLVATGFHRNTMINTEGGTDDEEFRVAAVVDRVNTTMEVWMGSTFACVQCHNHKYDPFSQAEYFQLYAFFNNTADPGRSFGPQLPLPTAEQIAARQAIVRQQFVAPIKMLSGAPLAAVTLLKPVRESLTQLKKKHDAIPITSTLIMRELPKPRETYVHVRGNHLSKGAVVTPGVPAKLHPMPVGAPMNRLGLAQWLVHPSNPLVGRVIMNRIWARYFGKGIVETSEDFGMQGEPPTHPELLDYLATEFVAQKWSFKAMHKLIVTSSTYRQSSRVTPELLERDPYNRLFARASRLRLEAEAVRDNALAISGLLKRAIGGPSVFPYQPEGVWANPYSGDRWTQSKDGDQYRRGLYTFWRRTAPYASFMAFDAPSREVTCERRPRSNTPLQALATLNDKAFVDCAIGLARRTLSEAQGEVPTRLEYAFRLCVARKPRPEEIKHLIRLYEDNLAKYRDNLAAAKLLAGGQPPTGFDPAQFAAWIVVANVLLNLDETITRG